MKKSTEKLAKELDKKFTRPNEPLSKHTMLKIGGPADVFFEAHSVESLVNAAKKAKKQNAPVTILGWGSNVLISDRGLRGLVIKNLSKNIFL